MNNCKTTLFVSHLTVIDFSYLCPQFGMVGESWIVDLYLTGDLDQQGMIFDFGHIKKLVKLTIDDLFDHKLLIPTQSKHYERLTDTKDHNEHHSLFHFQKRPDQTKRYIEHRAPSVAICELPIDSVLPEKVKPYLIQEITKILPTNVVQVDLELRCETTDQPFYQYSHGLQYHDGDCQRIAHGHRSRLEIFKNGEKQPLLEQEWCEQWRPIYIATQRHIRKTLTTPPALQTKNTKAQLESAEPTDYINMSYQAEQGLFELTLPASLVHTVETETTIEQIADHIAATIRQRFPGESIKVKAYEGVNKGAIATYL